MGIQLTEKRQKVALLIVVASSVLMSVFTLALLTPLLIHTRAVGETKQAPLVTVRTQLDSPLRLYSVNVTTEDLKTPQYTFQVTNISVKAIRAFAISHEVVINGSPSPGGVSFSHILSAKSILLPGRSIEEAEVGGTTYSVAPEEIILSVDFVEFDDGSTWGADSFKMSEKLAGQRAGGHAAAKYLRSLLEKAGLPAVLDAITKNDFVLPSRNRSRAWEEGFHVGRGIVSNRIKKAHAEGGLKQIQRELGRPFDASEGRQEP